MKNFIDIDVMLRGRFIHTFRISMPLADAVSSEGLPVFSPERLKQHIESRLPSLKGKPYNICF